MISDLKHALRSLAKSPGFSVVAVVIVALGIGATAAMFSIVNALVLRPIALPDPDRLAVVYETHLERNLPQFAISVPNYVDWTNRNRTWESLAAYTGRTMNLTEGGDPELVQVGAVTANFLTTFGRLPVLGNNFPIEADRPGGEKLAIISDAFAKRRLGGTASALGKTLTLDGTVYTIVGVTGSESVLPIQFDVLVPLAADAAKEERMDHYLDVYGRLKAGVTLEQANLELQAIAKQIERELPKADHGWSTTVVPLEREIVSASVRTGIYVLLGAVGVLLLIACANLSNLMLVRASARAHETAVRAALGASRPRIVRGFVAESLSITAIGGVAGLLLAYWLVAAVRSLPLPRAGEISLDWRVLAVACVATLLTGLLAGVGPALKAARTDPQEVLKTRSSRAGSRSGMRDSLVVLQISLSLVLLIGAVLLARSFWRLIRVDPGFNSTQVLTLALRPTRNTVPFYDAVERDVAALPGVTHVGSISRLPLTSGNTQNEIFAVGPSAVANDQPVQASWRLIHGDYFSAMQIPLLRGQDFRKLTRNEARNAMVISASLARTLWGNDDPIGRQIKRINGIFTVIGVVGDVRSQQLGMESIPAFYMSINRFTYGPQSLVVRTTGELAPLVAALRETVKKIDPSVPIFQIRPMDEIRAASLQQERTLIALLSGFAGSALLLAALGTYGVIAFVVQQRTREVGIRIAIGAQTTDVLRLVLGQGARLAGLGIVIGLVIALAASRLLSSVLYATPATDVLSYLVAAFALVVTALAASLIPAFRAARVNPLLALRAE
ncbi:ABC transporter permease [Oleiharenicola lentus]|uniref:ABC transporter permease n=1 Tax=Oleiharenicola lentus TaxID=2508720 RepID=UPI003F6771EF